MNQFEKSLRGGDVVYHPTANLRGTAKKWNGRYWAAWNKAVNNIERDGYIVICCTGPRGGTTSANAAFKAIKVRNDND
jgi:hypothetical protein